MFTPVVRASASNISTSIVESVACIATPNTTNPRTWPSQISHMLPVVKSMKVG
jgi:hypothetical protein